MDLGAGDDFAELDVYVGSGTGLIVNSGSGDDTIGVAEFWSEVRGDDGDDLLTSFGASALYGGAGDDTLSVAVGGFSHDGALVSGGDGDDVLDVYHTLGEDNGFDNAETEMRGGAGSEQFNINLFDGVEPTVDLFLEEITLSSDIAQVRITDFVAGEDALAVDVSSFTQNGKFELDDVGLEDFEAADVPSFLPATAPDGSWYLLSLTFSGGDETADFVAQIFMFSEEGGVTLDDINILSGVGA